jgi:hypothetical protein
MHLKPTCVACGTKLEEAFLAGKYSPPILENVGRAYAFVPMAVFMAEMLTTSGKKEGRLPTANYRSHCMSLKIIKYL